ncbi:Zn(II)2Cys6 transcription factor domain-containing protein [Sporobolomyces koalae]|uniref:Zn(II)2Cys6 transcription factor domain-containing protein n=1 Tax=Sporobolomyces koalae TaxID=500713 RepID=UPI00317038F8
MNHEHDPGDPRQQPHTARRESFAPPGLSPVISFHHHPTPAGSAPSGPFSPHLAHTHPNHHTSRATPAFVPYSPLGPDGSASNLPTPPLPSSHNGSFGFGTGSSSSGYPIPPSTPAHEQLMTNMFGAALTSPGLPSSTTFGHDAQHAQSALDSNAGNLNGSKVIQKADRSCKKCRERRVRCDRQYPACARCKKRREDCSYGTGVFVETVEEGSDTAKIAELESKVAHLETQLKNASIPYSKPLPAQALPSRPSASPPAALPSLTREGLAAVVAHAVTAGLTNEESNVLDDLLNEQEALAAYANQQVPQRGSTRDTTITCFLLDASTSACCSKLPGLHLLRDRLPYFKANLQSLEPPHQLAVICLCAIGVRVHATPNLFGIPTVTQADGTPIHRLFRSVGARRERICHSLALLAMETSWDLGIVREKSYDNLDALVGLVQYLVHEEGRPEDARFFVRELVGMYLDLRHEELSAGTPTKLNEANTTAVFLADGAVSSACQKPSFISPVDLQDYFASGGLRVPDLVNMQLGELIEEQLGAPLNRPAILGMLTSLCLYVFSCHRVFAQVSNPRRPSGSSILPFLRNLWTVLDQIHNAVQRLQQYLVHLSSNPSNSDVDGDDPQAVDHAILLAVRADNSLVDLIMLIHVHLTEKYSASVFWPEKDGDEELEQMRTESSMRVYKCLKLLAFYCQLYLASQDKHNVFHLILRLEVLPNWTDLVAARIGSPGGPISEEFETTSEELEWFRSALELACYYSTRASARLEALQASLLSSYPAASPSVSLPQSLSAEHRQSLSALPSGRNSTQQQQSQPHAQQQQPQLHLQTTALPATVAFDTPASTASPLYTSSTSFASGLPSIQPTSPPAARGPAPSPMTIFDNRIPQASSASSNQMVVGVDFAMNDDASQISSQEPPSGEFVAGGGGTIAAVRDDVTRLDASADSLQNAFRSRDWGDLSLTSALGSGSDGSSVDGGELFKFAGKKRQA